MEKSRLQNQRVRQRVSAACDACRSRKVKCVDSGNDSKCSMCLELGIECTSDRPRKKRGPKNRYVQILRAQLDGHGLENVDSERCDLSLIAPNEIVEQIIDDWFKFIHPVAPLFRHARITEMIQASGRDSLPPRASCLLLVASICAATCASLPRRRHYHGAVTVESCLQLLDRLNFWSMESPITLERALTVYNFNCAVACVHGLDAALAYRLSGECTVCVKHLIQNELENMSFADQQVLKRLYWLVFAAQCTWELHGRRLLVLHHAHETSTALLPMVVSDEQLLEEPVSTPSGIHTQGHSYVAGLNALSRLFLIWQTSQAIRVQTIENLLNHIAHTHQALIDMPPELIWEEGVSQSSDFGFDVQKVNLKVTQLHIRANLLEQTNSLAKEQGFLVTPEAIVEERHLVIEELLQILYAMPEEVFYANGYSIVPKLRDIGSALLDELRTGQHGRGSHTGEKLQKLLAKLEHLDHWPIPHPPNL
ncbi:hypothetical protein DE146DRAFT_30917 [Phaeosphaeria sp. MPI-PUGE-AT-0046c]|nr:hypothetical protein DE146DRAFT_30917 [Phaeosphaeria sp. MPI-PUGE-AT-0046c]